MKKIIFLMVLFWPFICASEHIVGGDIYYTCEGEGGSLNSRVYSITYVQYFDCSSGFGDNSLILNIWHKGEHNYFPVLLDEIVFVGNPDYTCIMLPSDVCIEKRIYQGDIELEVSDSSYYVLFQDCCRTENVTNILNSSSVGLTHYFEISPSSQVNCNSSPFFSSLPPTSLCVNEYIELVQNAMDNDSDQLVYEFCAPLDENSDSQKGSPPPYNSIQFVSPSFDYDYPFGVGEISLDSDLGILSGVPSVTGVFVIGICISEYDNGVYLGTTRRDYEISVTPCEPLVSVGIDYDDLSDNGRFIVNSCGESVVEFNNLSTNTDYITDFIWVFHDGVGIDTSYEWNPIVDFEGAGSFVGELQLNSYGICPDTGFFNVNIVEDLRADFIVDYDTCISGPVLFTDRSSSVGSDLFSWKWNFGDDTFADSSSSLKFYNDPGVYPVSLCITDNFNCKDSVTHYVDWMPAPDSIIVIPDYVFGCVPLEVSFTNLSWPVDSTYGFFWDFGDGGKVFDAMEPSYIYNKEGAYDLYVSVVSPNGCDIETFIPGFINVERGPIADFEFFPDDVLSGDSDFVFVNNSRGIISSKWMFNDVDSSFIESPVYSFSDTGSQLVTLIVSDLLGCSDTLVKYIDVFPESVFFMPNAFTPNGDGKNDVYKGKGSFLGIEKFEFIVWDRWGRVVFRTYDFNVGWDGRDFKSQEELNSGVYIGVVRFVGSRGRHYEFINNIALVR